MKKTTLLFASILASFSLFSQSTFSVAGLYSMPMGSFGSSDAGNSGYAEAGFGFQLETQMAPTYFGPNLRLGVYFSYQDNPMNIQSLEDRLNDVVNNPQVDLQLEGGGYQPVRFMVGPTYHMQIDPVWTLNLKGGIGIMLTNMAPVQITAIDLNDNGTEYTDILYLRSRTALSFLAGVDFAYKLNKYWSVGAFADYSCAQQTIEAAFNTNNYMDGQQGIGFINTGILFRMNM